MDIRILRTGPLPILGALFLLACEGSVSGVGGRAPGEVINDPLPGEEEVFCQEAPTPLRRLSHDEYENTLALLYGERLTLDALALPADQVPHEFDNDAEGMIVTSTHAERYLDLATDLAGQLLQDSDAMLPCTPDSPAQWSACGEALVRQEGRRLFRRPPTDAEVEAYTQFFRTPEPNDTFQGLAELTLTLMLSAPEFLYRFENSVAGLEPGESGILDGYSLASRLSFLLWGTGPDDALLDAAEAGRLDDDAGLRAEAERLLDDDRARDAFVRFHGQWLDFERLTEVSKLPEDGFSDDVRRAMLEESERFIEHILFDGNGTLTDLLTSNTSYVNADLAGLYGVDAPASEWAEVTLPNRSGVLTQATFLASHGHPDRPSPVLRGVFLLERVLCEDVGAPPPDAEAMGMAAAEAIDPATATNRELYDASTASQPTCAGCHRIINPLGFAFEHYDTMGRFRITETNGRAIDASGSSEGLGEFQNAVELGELIARSESARACMVQKWARYSFAGGPMERAECFLDDLETTLNDHNGSIRELQLGLVMHPSFRLLVVPESE
ncbi:MAG: DUF1592 domain-containing protein [Myxococcota bacterium]